MHPVQELTDEVVLGNHDAAAIGQTDLAYFNPDARRAAEWTAEQLGESERLYLASLPFVLQRDDAFFVHDRTEAKKAVGALNSASVLWDLRTAPSSVSRAMAVWNCCRRAHNRSSPYRATRPISAASANPAMEMPKPVSPFGTRRRRPWSWCAARTI